MAIKVKESGFAIWKVLVILAAIIVLAGAAGFGIVLHDSTGVHLDSDVKISVEEGDGADSVAEKLKENGVIKYPLVFKLIRSVRQILEELIIVQGRIKCRIKCIGAF